MSMFKEIKEKMNEPLDEFQENTQTAEWNKEINTACRSRIQ